MKKILSLLAILSVATLAFAQTESTPAFQYTKAARPHLNEISVGCGIETMQDFSMSFGGALSSMLTAPLGTKYESSSSLPVFSLEYQRYLRSGRFAFGCVAGYQKMTLTYVYEDDRNKTTDTYTDFLILMPSAKVMWFNRKHVGMYSRLAVGASLGTTDKIVTAMFQVDFVGVDFGGEHLRGFANIGFGAQGLFGAGLRYAF